ncbi:DUF4352 domain-containing protein [Nocardiopsis sp. CNT312]|uniref:DUF4352 domain-containing protein n=1 Tax=Nocardiopsis sp. CNT312 TaxID=1137268 RepID=UPI0004B81300|nr:DUF4352 domain-containing protein [Nocardiopsis sp. CNT312]
MSTGAKVAIGCGGCLGLSIITAIVFFFIIGSVAQNAGESLNDLPQVTVPSSAATSEEQPPAEEPADQPAAENGVTMTAAYAGTVGDIIDDTVYTAIDIEVVNDSAEPINVNPINFNVVLADGTVTSEWGETLFADIDAIEAVTLQPGQSTEGQIAVVGEVDVASVEMVDLFGEGAPVVAEVG